MQETRNKASEPALTSVAPVLAHESRRLPAWLIFDV